MIVSHLHRFIFLKTAKAAGTSIEMALSRHCGDQDIVTGLSKAEEQERMSMGGRHGQHNRWPLSLTGPRQWWRMLRGGRDIEGHSRACDVRRLVGREKWDSYRKFCVVRNPWDRTISQWFWSFPSEPRPSLEDFLTKRQYWSRVRSLIRKGSRLYLLDGKLAVDRVVRYEKLSEELAETYRWLGLPDDVLLPNAKSSSRKDRRPYQELYTPAARDRVAELFADDIQRFGYSFE